MTVILGIVVFLTLIPVARTRHNFPVALGLESREQYLARSEPTCATFTWANEHLPPNAHVLSQEQRTFWFEATVTCENIFRRTNRYDSAVGAPKSSLAQVLIPLGFTHLLLAEGGDSRTAAFDVTLSAAYDAEASARRGRSPVVAEFQSTTPDFGPRRYRIVELR
ncbi:MAG: hypothetical protein QM775_07090 [Pirellulales bacterium]